MIGPLGYSGVSNDLAGWSRRNRIINWWWLWGFIGQVICTK
jgi:hypothetical protein